MAQGGWQLLLGYWMWGDRDDRWASKILMDIWIGLETTSQR